MPISYVGETSYPRLYQGRLRAVPCEPFWDNEEYRFRPFMQVSGNPMYYHLSVGIEAVPHVTTTTAKRRIYDMNRDVFASYRAMRLVEAFPHLFEYSLSDAALCALRTADKTRVTRVLEIMGKKRYDAILTEVPVSLQQVTEKLHAHGHKLEGSLFEREVEAGTLQPEQWMRDLGLIPYSNEELKKELIPYKELLDELYQYLHCDPSSNLGLAVRWYLGEVLQKSKILPALGYDIVAGLTIIFARHSVRQSTETRLGTDPKLKLFQELRAASFVTATLFPILNQPRFYPLSAVQAHIDKTQYQSDLLAHVQTLIEFDLIKIVRF